MEHVKCKCGSDVFNWHLKDGSISCAKCGEKCERERGSEEALTADGFDEAILGVARRACKNDVVAYDVDLCIQELMKEGLSCEDAVDHFEYNVVGGWVGEGTPIFVQRMDKDELAEYFEEQSDGTES